MKYPPRLLLLSILFFLSGFSALSIELVFVKYLGYVFGTTAHAISTVLSAFMLGLSLGNVIGGRYSERIERRLRWYGGLELGVGVFAVLAPLLFRGLGELVGQLGSGLANEQHGIAWLTAMRFVFASLVVLPPTVAMGLSFPILVRYIRDLPDLEGNIGRLYTINTLGAAMGTIACTYAMIAACGLSGTLQLVCGINACVFLGCWFLDRGDVSTRSVAASEPTNGAPARKVSAVVGPSSANAASDLGADAASNSYGACTPLGRVSDTRDDEAFARQWLSPTWLYVLSAVSGFVTLSFEVLWSHLLATVVGTSTYAFGLVLAIFLLALALSGALVSKYVGQWPSRTIATVLGAGMLATGVAVAYSMQNWERAGAIFELVGYFKPSFFGRELTRAAIVVWLIFVPAMAMGILFPTALCLQRQGREGASRRVGITYAVNTAGTIVGSTVTGFWLIEHLGSQGTMRLLAGAVTLVALPVLWVVEWRPLRFTALAIGVFCCGSLFWSEPWDIARMTTGSNIYFAPGFDRGRHELVHFVEDVHGGMTTVVSDKSENTLMTNGKFEGNNGPERLDQVLIAAIPNLYVNARDRALNIGIGTGQTAAVLRSFGYRHLDAVDISPNIVETSRRWFKDVHQGVFDEANVHVHIRDGRNHLLLTRNEYDLISIELTSVWFASAGNLYSREFYELCRRRMTEHGVLQQWVQMHHIELDDIATIIATMKAVFPDVELWLGGHQGILVAGRHLPEPDPSVLLRTSARGRELFALAGLEEPAAVLTHRLVPKQRMDAVLRAITRKPGRLSTDDSVVLEYSTPRGNALENAEEQNLRAIRKALAGAG